MGFIGCNLNPDPSGGYWTGPPLFDRYWYPLYEAMVELDVPAMIHVSAACNPHFHTTGSHYLGADTTAFMQLLTSDVLRDFPDAALHHPSRRRRRARTTGVGSAASPRTWASRRSPSCCSDNIFFDTCVYHQAGIDCLLEVIPADNILFASEMVGAVRGVDPETGHYFDDTRRYIDAAAIERRRTREDLRRPTCGGCSRGSMRPDEPTRSAMTDHHVVVRTIERADRRRDRRARPDRNRNHPRGDRPPRLRRRRTCARSSRGCGWPGRRSPCRAIPATT